MLYAEQLVKLDSPSLKFVNSVRMPEHLACHPLFYAQSLMFQLSRSIIFCSSTMQDKSKEKCVKTAKLDCARNAQLANLAQDVLNPRIEIATGVLIASGSVEILLHLGHAAVGFRAEA